jgi:hypothetical protein
MIEIATTMIDPIAEDSWADGCEPLMPTYREQQRRAHEAEAARRAELVRREAEARAAAEARRDAERHAAAERKKQEATQRQGRERARAARNTDPALSPSSSRTIVTRKSGASLGESGSGGSDAASSRRPKRGSQKKEDAKGKGREVATEWQEPLKLPKNAKLVSRISFVSFHPFVSLSFSLGGGGLR